MSVALSNDTSTSTPEPAQTRLMIRGVIGLEGPNGPEVEVQRTMAVIGCDDLLMGQVAGVLYDTALQCVTAVVLGNYSGRPEYRQIDPGLIVQVVDEVRLRIPGASWKALPRYGHV
ncbi:MAG: hypothetical protein JNL73_22010 [Anaerolineales bacterium]|nr:hypothetical protein [Anaerolineales bacterium]